MRWRWIAQTAAVLAALAAGCGEETVLDDPNLPVFDRLLPGPELPSNSGIVVVFRGEASQTPFDFDAHLTLGFPEYKGIVPGEHEEWNMPGGKAVYWTPSRPKESLTPVGPASFFIAERTYSKEDVGKQKRLIVPKCIDLTVVGPDEDPPRFLRHAPSVTFNGLYARLELHFSEPVLWGRIEAEYMVDGKGPYSFSPWLHPSEGGALVGFIRLGEQYDVRLRNILDLSENEGAEAAFSFSLGAEEE